MKSADDKVKKYKSQKLINREWSGWWKDEDVIELVDSAQIEGWNDAIDNLTILLKDALMQESFDTMDILLQKLKL